MAKSKYDSHIAPHIDKITKWAEKGLSDKDIAEKLHIADSTFRKYIALANKGDERYAEFSAALARGKAVSDDEVESALYKRCTGYNAIIAKTFKVKRAEYDPDTGRKVAEHEELVIGHDEVHVPADTNAQIFWLTNRRGEKWKRDPQKAGNEENDGGGVIEIAPVNTEVTPDA